MNAIVDFLTEGTVSGELLAELGGVVADLPAAPSQIHDLGLYTARGMFGTVLEYDVAANTGTLIPVSARGTDARKTGAGTRGSVFVKAVRLAEEAEVSADEALNVRALGSAAPATARQLLEQKLAVAVANVRATREFHALGGIKGLVLDTNGAVISDLYSKMGVSKPGIVYFDLDKTTPKMGDVRKACSGIVRSVRDAMIGEVYTGVHAFVGADFFDALVDHKETRETYLNQTAAAELRGQTVGKRFFFAGIMFEEYNGGSYGEGQFIAADEARFFPVGSSVFQQWFAPHDRNKDMVELGMIEYALPFADPKGRLSSIEIQSNPATICTRPLALIEGRAGAAA